MISVRRKLQLQFYGGEIQFIISVCVNYIDSDSDGGSRQSSVAIVCTDFPRYFVAVSRVRLASCVVGNSGGSLKTDSTPVTTCVFPVGSVRKETKVGLQVTIQS